MLGIALMLVFCVVVPLSDAMAKIATATIPILQIILLRFVLGSLLLVPVVLATGRSLLLPKGLFGQVALRTFFHVAASCAMLVALRHLPLAETLAIVFVQPFMMMLTAWLFLGESSGPRRLAACAAGFLGTLLVIQPAFAEAGWVVLLPLLTAALFTVFMLITRRIAKSCDPLSLQAVSGLLALPLLAPLFLFGPALGLPDTGLILPDASGWALLVGISVLATVAHLMMTLSLRFAPASMVAPIQYLELPVAVVVGWLLFRDFPDALALLGIAVILVSGLYMMARERAVSRAASSAPPMPKPVRPEAAAPASEPRKD